jgi:hypothetical protein
MPVNSDSDLLAAEVARELLERAGAGGDDELGARIAAEKRAFDVLAEAYFDDPRRALAASDGGGGYLKFGIPGIEELLTPIFLAASAEVVAYLAERGIKLTRQTVRRVLSGPPEEDAAPELSKEQWAHVRQILVTALMKHARMSRRRAETIASAVVGDGLTGE